MQNIVSFTGLFAKETYNFKGPTNRSNPIALAFSYSSVLFCSLAGRSSMSASRAADPSPESTCSLLRLGFCATALVLPAQVEPLLFAGTAAAKHNVGGRRWNDGVCGWVRSESGGL